MMGGKMILIKILFFVWASVVVSVESAGEQKCKANGKCAPKGCRYKECRVPNKGRKITSITMHNPTSKGECNFHKGLIPTSWSCDQGPVYGFVDEKIVVAGGCSGVFIVCYTDPVDDFIDKITFRPCEDGDDCDDFVSGYQCQCFPVYAWEGEQPVETSNICEGEATTISCSEPPASVEITCARYGRTSAHVYNNKTLPLTNTECQDVVTEIVKNTCDGKDSDKNCNT